MGRFSRKPTGSTDGSHEDQLDYQLFLGEGENQSVDERLKNLMNKFMVRDNVEFDQVCLVLKHYMLDESSLFLERFVTFDAGLYVKQTVEKFYAATDNPNLQWMITELIKLVSSLSNLQLANGLLQCSEFVNFLLTSVFGSRQLIENFRQSTGLTSTQAAILTNIIETISNLCEIKHDLIQFVSASHVQWLTDSLACVHQIYQDLAISFARLLSIICEHSGSSFDTPSLLFDQFVERNFFKSCMEHLSTSGEVSVHLNAKLYLMTSLVHLVISNGKCDPEKRARILLEVFKHYGNLIEYSLNAGINEKALGVEGDNHNGNKKRSDERNGSIEEATDEVDLDDSKLVIKSVDLLVEAKLLAIDLIVLISGYFVKDDESNEDDYESVDEDDDEQEQTNEKVDADMETEQPGEINNNEISEQFVDPKDKDEFKNIINHYKLLDLLVKTLVNDNENCFQENDKIQHVHDGIEMVKSECLKAYTLLIENFYMNTSTSGNDINLEHLSVLFTLVLNSPTESNELIGKLSELAYDLFVYFNDLNAFTLQHYSSMIESIKQILFKHRISVIDLCVRMARVLGLIGIKLRDTNATDGQDILTSVASILLEMTVVSFESGDQTSPDLFRLNAELLDVLIDLFGEDCLADVEKSLNFVERIKSLSEKFYSKYKQLNKTKPKGSKQNSVIIRTVKDNFRSFVDYKIKNSK